MFIDPSQFEFIAQLESNWETIRDEYAALAQDAFDPWVQRQMHGDGWSVFGLVALGQQIAGACKKCPRTAGILAGISVPAFTVDCCCCDVQSAVRLANRLAKQFGVTPNKTGSGQSRTNNFCTFDDRAGKVEAARKQEFQSQLARFYFSGIGQK